MNLRSVNTKNLSYGKELAKRQNVNKQFKSYIQSDSTSFKGGHNLDINRAAAQPPKTGFWSKCKKIFKQIFSNFRFKNRNLQTDERDNIVTSDNQKESLKSLYEALSCLGLKRFRINNYNDLAYIFEYNRSINKNEFEKVVEQLKGKEDKSAMALVLKNLCPRLDKSLTIKNFDKYMDISEDNVDQLLEDIEIEKREVTPKLRYRTGLEVREQIVDLYSKTKDGDLSDADYEVFQDIIPDLDTIENFDENLSHMFLCLFEVAAIAKNSWGKEKELEDLFNGLIQNLPKMKFNEAGIQLLSSILKLDSLACIPLKKKQSLIDEYGKINIDFCDENQKQSFISTQNNFKLCLYSERFHRAINPKKGLSKNTYAAKLAFEGMLNLKEEKLDNLDDIFASMVVNAYNDKLITAQNKKLLVDFMRRHEKDINIIRNYNLGPTLSKFLLPDDVKGTRFETEIKSLSSNQDKYNKLKFCMLSDEYFLQQLLLSENLDIYNDEVLQIIRNFDFSAKSQNVEFSNEQRIEILKVLYGKDFVKLYIDEIQSKTKDIDEIEKKANEQSIQEEINKNKDIVLKRQQVIMFFIDTFESVYDDLMSVSGLSYLRNNKTLKFNISNYNHGIAWYQGGAWIPDMKSNTEVLYLSKNTFDVVNSSGVKDAPIKEISSIFLHELTHYIQNLLVIENIVDLSTVGQEIFDGIRSDIKNYNNRILDYKSNYSKDTRELGAHMTQFFDGVERFCGKQHGEYFVVEKGTKECRDAQAKEIVKALKEKGIFKSVLSYILQKKQCSIEEVLDNLLDNIDYLTKIKATAVQKMFNNIMNSKGITVDDLALSEDSCCKHFETIFSEALKYLIPKEDMIKINDKLSQK